ncbi:2-succinyl-6-hydroxy-2, 4-cyclohexadiene-1-carboxylate synthase [Alphaproteobacteria bacterium SO-S41]|nr:2-succinyl-6-hydroxy-2, 4-cyclohexadiene-1-carboxylate synthase [Alphaproteobacteria bacterium SO-S41]
MSLKVEVRRAVSGTLTLAYDDVAAAADAPPVLLVHGFASSRRTNWVSPGWYRAFAEAGRRVIAFDHRGHGESERSHDAADYDEGLMAADCAAVLEECGAASADVFGYSMGAMVAIRLLMDAPGRVRRAVLGGLGENYLTPPAFSAAVPEALLTEDPATIVDLEAKGFRTFADRQKQDRFALAACWQRPRTHFDAGALARIDRPVLVICGANDTVTGSPDRLAAAIPGAVTRIVPNRDHMSAVGDRVTKAEVLAFLGG